MKLTFRQIEPFVKTPNPDARVILVYGPDYGLMRERSKTMAKTIVADINDPFNVATLTPEKIIEDPAILEAEAQSISMMGGNRLIRIESANEKIVPALKEYLKNPSTENLVIVEAGELGTKSALRKLCESAKNAAAVPCYLDDERNLAGLIRSRLQENGFVIKNDAVTWLATNISGDRQKAMAEVEKLMTYMGLGTEAVSREISLNDVMACCGEAGAQSFDNLVFSTGLPNPQKPLRAYYQLLEEGVPVVAILRALQNHFRRLHYTKTLVESGLTLEQAMKKLQPAVFFKNNDAFMMQFHKWPEPFLRQVLERLNMLEASCKQTGTPVETVCGQAILSLSRR